MLIHKYITIGALQHQSPLLMAVGSLTIIAYKLEDCQICDQLKDSNWLFMLPEF